MGRLASSRIKRLSPIKWGNYLNSKLHFQIEIYVFYSSRYDLRAREIFVNFLFLWQSLVKKDLTALRFVSALWDGCDMNILLAFKTIFASIKMKKLMRRANCVVVEPNERRPRKSFLISKISHPQSVKEKSSKQPHRHEVILFRLFRQLGLKTICWACKLIEFVLSELFIQRMKRTN